MGVPVSSNLIKFLEEEVGFGAQLSRALIQKIAASLNAFCDYKDVMCTELTGNGVYTTKSKASSLITVATGGGGGGGGGANGGIVDYTNQVTSMELASGGAIPNIPGPSVYDIVSEGTDGGKGLSGGHTTFGGTLIAAGGLGGEGGTTYTPFWIINPATGSSGNENIWGQDFVLSEFNQKVLCIKNANTDSHTMCGDEVSEGGAGGLGTQSTIVGSSPSGIGSETDTFGGTNGFCGKRGNIGWRCIQNVQPGTAYPYSVGVGGIGGAPGPSYSVSVGGGTLVKSNGFVAGNGEDGKLIIFELGF